VTASFQEGSAVLRGKDGDVTLAFGADAAPSVLAPGKYRVRATRIVREGWLLSSSGAPWPEFVVKDALKERARLMDVALTARLEVGETVRFEGRAKRQGGKLQLGFALKGADGRGLTVYKEGARVPVTYKVLAADGAVLAEGAMTYG
jgi:hypothetical protein